MNRAAVVILFLGACFIMACGKSTSTGKAVYEAQKAIDDKIIADYLKANPTLNATKIDTSGFTTLLYSPVVVMLCSQGQPRLL
ncbi:hypothetical protein HK413_05670 [Mucilaginibacter sp. S1162]|uniref:Uncharacterized protein n=1 Tax=Mucilaginibacter humi TaxID=2732510 RepID=A0ABX1W427_9SPHI|nr:hypothetical protein [Mucilaginibacter humi]NNU33755.1 hypothetical protein [Mucilaginibacter humi]